jgi:hypothetical protein
MVRISSALTSLARDPFPFLLAVLTCRFLLDHSLAGLAMLLAAGFCVSVFEQALRADSAPLPRSKELPRTAYLGCLGGCGLWLAIFFSMAVMGAVLGALGLQNYGPFGGNWDHPLIQSGLGVVMIWLTQCVFVALWLTVGRSRVQAEVKEVSRGFFNCLFSFLKSPPLNGAGMRLAGLFIAVVLSLPLTWTTQQSLVQFSWLLFATLYAHCLGQYVRKGHGFHIS